MNQKGRTVLIRVHPELKKELKKISSEDPDCSMIMASKKAARFLKEHNSKFKEGSKWSRNLPF